MPEGQVVPVRCGCLFDFPVPFPLVVFTAVQPIQFRCLPEGLEDHIRTAKAWFALVGVLTERAEAKDDSWLD